MEATPATVKTQALDQLMAGTSILIPFAALAIKLPGWSCGDRPAGDELQLESDGAVHAVLRGISENKTEAGTPLAGAVSTNNITFDISKGLASANNGLSSDSQSDLTKESVLESGRYYEAVDIESQMDSDLVISDDNDDIDSLDDLEPLSPQSWEFDDEEMAEDELWHTFDDPVVLPGLPEIVVSPPPEDIFPPLEDIEAYDLELEGCF